MTTLQVPNENANVFEQLINYFLPQLQPERKLENDFWTNFEFNTKTSQEEKILENLVTQFLSEVNKFKE